MGVYNGYIVKRYVVTDRETGTYIDSFNTVEQAKKCIKSFERQDKKDKTYTENFYEIFDNEKQEII